MWYRGYTTKTNELPYFWLTKSLNHAKQYAEINAIKYGGKQHVDNYELDLSNKNILDLSMYDTDDLLNENNINEFLTDVNVNYDYESLFDYEDEIPLSRLINSIINEILDKYDGFYINENDIKTLCLLKNDLQVLSYNAIS